MELEVKLKNLTEVKFFKIPRRNAFLFILKAVQLAKAY